MGSNVKKTKNGNSNNDSDRSFAEDINTGIDVSLPVININCDSSEDKSVTSIDSALLYKERSSSTGSTSRKPSMAVLIPKQLGQQQGSCESINQSPQSSPGTSSQEREESFGRDEILPIPYSEGDCASYEVRTYKRLERKIMKSYDIESPSMRLPDTVPPGINLSRKESYKDQRSKYRTEKKRVAKELLSTLKDPSVVVLADWLKVRGTLKGWTKLWCVLKPGMLLLYKSSKAKSSHWTGTVLLNTCELIERPSKKDGFCFKMFHPLEQSIWATKGPEGETIGAMVQPLPSSHLIFRAPSQAAGKCWMDALELAARCSSILIRSMTSSKTDQNSGNQSSLLASNKWNESDYEKHFKDQDLDDASHTDEYEVQRESGHYSGAEAMSGSESDSDDGKNEEEEYADYVAFEEENEMPAESSYVFTPEGYIGETGEQTEELAEENKSLIWFLLKQVRPGMDLSKVVLPTFILEPRSFLDKLSDYYYHADILSKAVQEDDPYTRMKEVVRWYMSGFYKKPKGLKKPYNPILGETFRCYWKHPNNSRTFYVAEQVSHHPPVSALYITNRQDGFSVSATILAKSKFYGNSTSAILDGNARLTMLPRGEDYVMNMPYAHCKGILMGTLTMELGGKVTIECEKTGYMAELEFKLKPFLSGVDASNLVSGKLKLGKETLATLDGRWDRKITLTDKRTGEEELLWEVTKEAKEQRLPRHTISLDQQGDWESEKLWNFVSVAIKNDDQVAATEEKTILEEAQRAATRERKVKCEEWVPMYFRQDTALGVYAYHYSDLRPWDPRTDLFQYEFNYTISTKTIHKAPMIRTASIISVEPQLCESGRLSSLESKVRLRGVKGLTRSEDTSSGEQDELLDTIDHQNVLFQSVTKDRKRPSSAARGVLDALEEMKVGQKSLASEVRELRRDFESLQRRLSAMSLISNGRGKDGPSYYDLKGNSTGGSPLMSILMALAIYSFLQWALSWIFLL